MLGYFLEPHAPGLILVGRDPHTLGRWPRTQNTACLAISRGRVHASLHWYPVPHVGYRRSLPLVSGYFLAPLAPGLILVGRDPQILPRYRLRRV